MPTVERSELEPSELSQMKAVRRKDRLIAVTALAVASATLVVESAILLLPVVRPPLPPHQLQVRVVQEEVPLQLRRDGAPLNAPYLACSSVRNSTATTALRRSTTTTREDSGQRSPRVNAPANPARA